ncbi:MAG: hypothetical protein WC708_00200 [Lentisphaeria bacterium]|jgi:hypothetical protein
MEFQLKEPLTVNVGLVYLLFQIYKVSENYTELFISIMDTSTKEMLFSFDLRPTSLIQETLGFTGIPVFPGRENEIFDNFSRLDGVDRLDARITELFKSVIDNPEFRLRATHFVRDCIYFVKCSILKDVVTSSLPWIDPIRIHSLVDEMVVEQVIDG